MDPRTHQRDVGEQEHYPPQQDAGGDGSEQQEARARQKLAKNNKDSHDQTGQASAAAHEQAKRAGKP